MEYRGKQIVAIEIWAEGYYSSSFAGHVGFMFKEDYEKYEDIVNEFSTWFHELDGKHSEIEGTIDVHYNDEDIVKAVARQTDDYKFYENVLEHIAEEVEEEETNRIEQISQEIAEQFNVKTVVEVSFNNKTYTV